MLINGILKLTLLDYPGHTACTVFTGGCNFRCPFCQNAALVLRVSEQPVVQEEELFNLLEKRKGLLDGVCVTGGEPTLQSDLLDFLRRIKEKGFLVKLDTNGTRPQVISQALNEGLVDKVAMDIKTSRESYPLVAGISKPDMKAVEDSVKLLMSNPGKYEFRTTVVRQLHTAEDMRRIGKWIQGAQEYYLQGFKDSGDIIEDGFSAFSKDEMESLMAEVRPFVASVQLRGIE